MATVLWTTEDAEQFFSDYLEPILNVPVGGKSDTGSEFVRVRRTGGVKPTPVSDNAQLTFEAYARKPSRAWTLIEQTRAAVLAIAGTVVGDVQVKAVTEAGGPANLPDPTFEELSRYTVTLLVHLRAKAPV